MVNLECPNCGSTSISENWVEKAEVKESIRPFDEYAKEQLKTPPDQPYIMISSSGMEWKHFLQFNLRCNKCGYTKVYEVNGKQPK